MDGPRRLIPEVIQTSSMDCGPATLAALLSGFGIRTSYARLRDACGTDVDGTSIDAIEDAARRLGLDVAQVMLPVDHLALPGTGSVPAVVVTRQPGGLTHFVVAWRRHGGLLQLMDPGSGRRWVRRDQFLADVYVHQFAIPVATFDRWARSDALRRPLLRQLGDLGIEPADAVAMVDRATADGWPALAALDASARAVRAGGHHSGWRGRSSRAASGRSAVAELARHPELIGDEYWFGRPAGPGTVTIRGAVLVQVRGRTATPPDPAALSASLRAALTQVDPSPARFLRARLRRAGPGRLAAVLGGAVLAAAGLLAEAVLLRTLLAAGPGRAVIAALGAVGAVLWMLDGWLATGSTGVGRRLDRGLRWMLARQLPRLPDSYLRSRPVSDVVERAHRLHQLRELPAFSVELVRSATTLALLPVVIGILDPPSALPAVLAALVTTAAGFAFLPAQAERDIRVRAHTAAVARFYLDALVGLSAIRAHNAEPVVEAEHDRLLRPWAAAMRALHRSSAVAELSQGVIGLAFAAGLLLAAAGRVPEPATYLLLAYWAASLPAAGAALGSVARRYPAYRSTVLRLLEPLTTPTTVDSSAPVGTAPLGTAPVGAAVHFSAVTVVAGGRAVLEVDDLAISAGEQVAVVGRSGSGKSTVAGLLLGWHQPATGQVRVDGHPLDPGRLAELRRRTAWVDPAVTVWNAPLVDNLRYGNDTVDDTADPELAIRDADLGPLRAALGPDLRVPLGEGGGLLSGGEAQRVRLGRARLRPDVGLVILDEPFRGLGRDRRHTLLGRVRSWWPGATLLFVTHDVTDTLDFDRVLVVSAGRVVEDGPPAALAAAIGSHYRELLDAEAGLEHHYRSPQWREVRVAAGRVSTPVMAGGPQ